MRSVSHPIDRVQATFDDSTLVADAGLIVHGDVDGSTRSRGVNRRHGSLVDRVGGAHAERKVLTLVASILIGGSHIDHADRLRVGATQKVLPFRVMAPSTLGRFLRSFTFGRVRQLQAIVGETLRRAWAMASGPGDARLVIDVDSTI